jgi:hypothetical protein
MSESYSDCRDKQGVLVGLIDTIINSARIYKILSDGLDLDHSVLEALKDMRSDEDVMSLLLSSDKKKFEIIKELTSSIQDVLDDSNRIIADDFWNLI